jgi:hypothetical protein
VHRHRLDVFSFEIARRVVEVEHLRALTELLDEQFRSVWRRYLFE